MTYAIEIHNLSKLYRLQEIREDSFKKVLLSLFRPSIEKPYKEFWALKDISLTVSRGEVLGILGHNGAGKSTLLKILSRITEPSEGYAKVNGRVGTLLEIGTGFHPDLTGLENIYLNGAILGMSEEEITQQRDRIIQFSGVEAFIHTPVKYYSSGMAIRLAFAVAAHLQADILFLDEVWGVGDQEFAKQSIAKMREIVKSGRTVILISHDPKMIEEVCTRCLWLDHGRVLMDGPAKEVLSSYLLSSKKTKKSPETK